MNKAVKAVIAVIIIGGAIYYMYGKMKELGYFQSAPPPQTQMQNAPEGRPLPGAPAPNAAPATDTAAAATP